MILYNPNYKNIKSMIKQILLFLTAFLLIIFKTTAQERIHIQNGCHFDGSESGQDLYAYPSSNEAQQIVSRLTAAIGLEQNFTIKSANVTNALATTEGGQRYILYSTTFLENFKRDARTQWAAYCVFAHEMGHHLNNHNFAETSTSKRKSMELKADIFAGNILQKMGATLDEAQAGINTFSLKGESNTHPPKSARLEAVAQGWKQAQEMQGEKVSKKIEPAPSEKKPDSEFNIVSGLLIENKIIGNWESGKGIYNVFSILKDGTAKMTSTYKVSNTTQVTNYKWTYKNGIFSRNKVFVNGSLGSTEQFTIEFMGDNTFVLKNYGRMGESSTWNKLK